MEKITLRNWTLWRNDIEKRIFLVVEIPNDVTDKVTMMEVKEYAEEEPRVFINCPYSDWVTLTDANKLKPFIPKI